MFNIGSGEIALIAVVALLVLGPSRLPELARGIGKFVREFRRQTDEVRGVVEREFYKMDAPEHAPVKDLPIQPAQDSVAANALPDEPLPPPPADEGRSQLTAGLPHGPVEQAAVNPDEPKKS